jgi:hypothetical protein
MIKSRRMRWTGTNGDTRSSYGILVGKIEETSLRRTPRRRSVDIIKMDMREVARKKVMGLERGPLSLVSTTEELLDRKVTAPV